jgi:hypothetical protein
MRKHRGDRPVTLIELCVDRAGGFRHGAKVMAFVVAWGVAREQLGHTPTVEEYAAWWKQNERSAYREMAMFREAFAPDETPDRILDAMVGSGAGASIDASAVAAA